MTALEARTRLLEHFTNNSSDQPSLWAQLWENGDFLPWDRGLPNPALFDILTERQDLIGTCLKDNASGEKERKKAFVPGCGRGYDVLLLASFGYDAYGLEVSEKAVQNCVWEQSTNGHNYPVQNQSAGAGNVVFLQGDFFSNDWTQKVLGNPVFDLIYDYTVRNSLDLCQMKTLLTRAAKFKFLCALPPFIRPAWALRQSQLLAPAPHGNLICLEFPTYKDPSTLGPPFGLTPETYVEHLSHPGESIPYDENGYVKRSGPGKGNPMALERIAHWQPQRTHEVGKGTDSISVWRHQQA